MKRRFFALVLSLALFIAAAMPSFAAQGTGCMPTTGTVSGLTFAQDVNAAIAALISSNSGSSAPATDCSAAAVKGQVWLDTSVTPNAVRMWDGASSWVTIGWLDATNHLWSPPSGGGTATIASATTTDLWSSTASAITVSGTTTVTQFASSSAVPGTVKRVMASGVFTLTYDATQLILPGAQNVTTAAGDWFEVLALTSTNVSVISYTRADGSALTNPALPLGTILYGDFGTVPAKTVEAYGQALSRASYPAYLAAVTRAQTGTLTASNNTITSVSNTAGMGAGMPIEASGIPANTTISSVTGSTIVMSQNATANGSQTVTVFLTGYGSGGNTSTVGAKDCRGRTLAGRDDLGGTPAGNLTSTYFGAGRLVINGTGGAETKTMLLTNLPPYIPTGVITNGAITTTASAATAGSGGASAATNSFNSSQTSLVSMVFTSIQASSTFAGAAQGGASTPFLLAQPTGIAECVVVVLP